MRQNVIIVLLSVIATLLFVLVIQNSVTAPSSMQAQTGGGAGATVGTIGVATGTLQGSDAAGFWIFDPGEQKVLVYDMMQNQLRLRAVRDIQYDLQAIDFSHRSGKAPTVKDMATAIQRLKGSGSSRK